MSAQIEMYEKADKLVDLMISAEGGYELTEAGKTYLDSLELSDEDRVNVLSLAKDIKDAQTTEEAEEEV